MKDLRERERKREKFLRKITCLYIVKHIFYLTYFMLFIFARVINNAVFITLINFIVKTKAKRHIYIHLMSAFCGITIMMTCILHLSNV